MNFDIFIFKIPVTKHGMKKINKTDFWKQEEVKNSEIRSAKGVYIFGTKYGDNYKPWYVGKTNSNFGDEATHPDKLRKYEHCINEVKGKPFIIFIAVKTTKNRKFSTKNNNKLIEWLEDFFIKLAYQRNTELINTAKTKWLRKVYVPSVLHAKQGDNNKNGGILKKVLGI